MSDADFNVLYANDRCKKIFKELLNQEGFVGKNMTSCHKPGTVEKLKVLYNEYREKTQVHGLLHHGRSGRNVDDSQCALLRRRRFRRGGRIRIRKLPGLKPAPDGAKSTEKEVFEWTTKPENRNSN